MSKYHILIVGAGPIGLYESILLKSKFGDAINVTVADAHLLDYDRPGIIAKKAVENINQSFAKFRIPIIDVPDSGATPANSVFISDLQQALYQQAKQFRVALVEASFESIEEQTVILTDGQTLICDLVIDCSGERRATVRYVSQEFQSKSAFEVTSIDDNPLKHHFIAYIKIDVDNAQLFKIQDIDEKEPVFWCQKMHTLQTSFNWPVFCEPEINVSKWKLKDGGVRACLYYEVPVDVARASTDKQKNYLESLLYLKTGHQIEFEIEEEGYHFTPFDVAPKVVNNAVNDSNFLFNIVVCGDALMSAEYRFGTGITNGILCARGLLDAIGIQDKSITLSKSYYEHVIQGVKKQHVDMVRDSYALKKTQLSGRDLITAYDRYTEAFDTLTQLPSQKTDLEQIENGLYELAVQLKNSAGDYFLRGTALKKQRLLYKADIQKAEDFYSRALNLFENYCPYKQDDEQLHIKRVQLYMNLSKCFYQNNRLSESIPFAEKALHIAKGIEDTQLIKKSLDTLAFLCKAYVKSLDSDAMVDMLEIKNQFVLLQETAMLIDVDPMPYTTEIQRLNEKLQAFKPRV